MNYTIKYICNVNYMIRPNEDDMLASACLRSFSPWFVWDDYNNRAVSYNAVTLHYYYCIWLARSRCTTQFVCDYNNGGQASCRF